MEIVLHDVGVGILTLLMLFMCLSVGAILITGSDQEVPAPQAVWTAVVAFVIPIGWFLLYQ